MLRKLLSFIATLWLSLLLVGYYPGWRDSISWYIQRELCRAAAQGRLTEVKVLGMSGASLDGWNTTYQPIHFAVEHGHIEVIDYLLRQGVSVNTPDRRQRTPLMAAVDNGHTEAVKLLLERGANVNAGSEFRSALDMSEEKGYKEISAILRRAGAKTGIELKLFCAEFHFASCGFSNP